MKLNVLGGISQLDANECVRWGIVKGGAKLESRRHEVEEVTICLGVADDRRETVVNKEGNSQDEATMTVMKEKETWIRIAGRHAGRGGEEVAKVGEPRSWTLLEAVDRALESPEHGASRGIEWTLDALGGITVDNMTWVQFTIEEGLGDIQAAERPVEGGADGNEDAQGGVVDDGGIRSIEGIAEELHVASDARANFSTVDSTTRMKFVLVLYCKSEHAPPGRR